jgi:hypothetical protein
MKLVGKQHGSGIWRPPQDRLVFVVPGENAVSVRFKEPLWTEISADGKETFGGCLINWWKTKIVLLQANHRHVRYVKRVKKTMPWER